MHFKFCYVLNNEQVVTLNIKRKTCLVKVWFGIMIHDVLMPLRTSGGQVEREHTMNEERMFIESLFTQPFILFFFM